jgi:predicted KAP-like P-loop ATPase
MSSVEAGVGSSGPRDGFVRADAPIEGRSQDRLNRATLANAIADQVVHGPAGHGLVIGIAGKWGSGKTSLLRMVEETVREKSDTTVLSFNPWLFSSTDELVSRFLKELGIQLRDRSRGAKSARALGKAGDRLLSYGEALEPFGWAPVVGASFSRVGKLSRAVRGVARSRREPSVEQQRELVREQLRALDTRVLVTVDDLDRIEADQIRDMVRLIKLVGDFPNTTYLVSYDPKPVEEALGEERPDGRAYLEKIVQVVHDLPEPPPTALRRMLGDELQEIVDAIEHGPFRADDWQNLLAEGMWPFFRTVRDVRRYLNTVPVSLRVIGPEVALVDVLALEAVRVFASDAYARLPAAAAALTRAGTDSDRRAREDADRVEVTALVEAAGDFAEPVKEIIRRLFRGAGHFVGGSQIVESEQRARRDLRVSSPEILSVYLHRTLPEGTVSGALVANVVASLADPERLDHFFGAAEPDLVEVLIQRLEDYEAEFDPTWAEPAIPVLLNQLPRLREGTHGMFDFGVEMVVGRVVLRLLRRVEPEEERLNVVRNCLPAIAQLSGRMELLDTAGHRENAGHKLIPADQAATFYAELNTALLTSSAEVLAAERQLMMLFVRIVETNGHAAKEWIQSVTADDAVLLRLLRSGLREQRSQTMGDYAVRTTPAIPWPLLVEWLGEDLLRTRVTELAETQMDAALEERTALALQTAVRYVSGELPERGLP